MMTMTYERVRRWLEEHGYRPDVDGSYEIVGPDIVLALEWQDLPEGPGWGYWLTYVDGHQESGSLDSISELRGLIELIMGR